MIHTVKAVDVVPTVRCKHLVTSYAELDAGQERRPGQAQGLQPMLAGGQALLFHGQTEAVLYTEKRPAAQDSANFMLIMYKQVIICKADVPSQVQQQWCGSLAAMQSTAM